MCKIPLNNLDLDELEDAELEYKQKNRKRYGKRQKNSNDKDFQQPQGVSSGWREGDSYIGIQKKQRNHH